MLALLWIAALQASPAEPAEPAEPAGQAGPAAADDAPEEIVVTGERVARTLRETASSAVVLTQAELEAHPADRVEQLLAAVPNVQLGHGSEGPAIRGLDTTGPLQALPAFLGGNRPRTTLIVDGRPVTYNEFVFGAEPVWDVERIELFRSPQTTTQGQNSIAGAIFVHTNEPSFEPQYRARLVGGDFRTRQLSALASGPIAGEEIAFRVAGDLRYSRTTSKIADRADGADPNHDVYGIVRAKLLVEPAALPNSRIVLTYSHLQSQAPQVVGLTAPFRKRRDESGLYGTFRINVDSLTAAVRHDAGDLTANAIVTAGDSLAKRLAFPGLGQSRIEGRDWSVEMVANWSPNGPVRLLGGASHRHLALDQFIDLSLLSGIGRFRDRQDGSGTFGEAIVSLAPRATLTAGLRYQRDSQRRTGSLAAASGSSIDLDYDRTFHAWLPKLSFAYDFTPEFRAGLLVQRAYNPGGTTVRFDTGLPDNFEAETLWDYELFVRSALADGRLTANANLFYYDMRNAQRAEPIEVLAPNGFPVGFADLFNVPKARSYGMEASLEWRPAREFSAALGIGLLRTSVVRTEPDNAGIDGKEFDRAPRMSASASFNWRPSPRLQLSGQVRHHSSYYSDPFNDPQSRIGSGTIVNARAEYRFDRFSLFGYVRNVFDAFNLVSRFGNRSAVAEDPREIGVGIGADF